MCPCLNICKEKHIIYPSHYIIKTSILSWLWYNIVGVYENSKGWIDEFIIKFSTGQILIFWLYIKRNKSLKFLLFWWIYHKDNLVFSLSKGTSGRGIWVKSETLHPELIWTRKAVFATKLSHYRYTMLPSWSIISSTDWVTQKGTYFTKSLELLIALLILWIIRSHPTLWWPRADQKDTSLLLAVSTLVWPTPLLLILISQFMEFAGF